MKKLYYALILLMAIVISTSSAFSQKKTVAKSGNEFTISISGVTFDFESKKKVTTKMSKDPKTDFFSGIRLGISTLSAPDYSLYPERVNDFLDLDNFKSTNVAIAIFNARGYFNKRKTLYINSGLVLKYDNYALNNRNTLKVENGMLTSVQLMPSDKYYKKTKLTNIYLNVPVTLGVKVGKNISVEAGVYGDILMRSFTKYKFPKTKERGDYKVNFLQYGITGAVGFHDLYIYCNYGMSELFKKDKGPKTYPISIGVGFGF